ncbi:hypothetical protein B566_EDAN016042, partial [Ephemera danica]
MNKTRAIRNMAQQKTTSLKLFLLDNQDRQIEVRRFGVDQDITFAQLCNKFKTIFTILQTWPFQISWKDADGDDIIVSSDEELQEAFSVDSECCKLRIKLTRAAKKIDVPECSSLFLPTADESGEPVLHRGVVCDGCENEIKGARFKCLQCGDFDLCRSCENTGLHADHAMLRFCKPIDPTKTHRLHKFCHMSKRLFENNLKDGSESYNKSVASQTESIPSETNSDVSQDQAASNAAATPEMKEEKPTSASHTEAPKPAEVQSNFMVQVDTTNSATRNNGPAAPQNMYPNLGFSFPPGPMPTNNTPRPQRQYTIPIYHPDHPAVPIQNLGYSGYGYRPSTDMYSSYSAAATRNIPVVNSPFLYSTSSGASANATYTFPRPGQGMRPSNGPSFVHSSVNTGPVNRNNPIGSTLGSTVPFVQFSNSVVNPPPVPANLPEPLVPTPVSTARLPTAPAATARTFAPHAPAVMTDG